MKYHHNKYCNVCLLPGMLSAFATGAVAQAGPSTIELSRKVFVIAKVSKTTCFVGEPLEVTYDLYSSLSASSVVKQLPGLTGFTSSIINQAGNINPVDAVYAGQQYKVYTLRKIITTPLFAGDLTIDAMKVEHTINVTENKSGPGTAMNVDDLMNQLSEKEKAGIKVRKIANASNTLLVHVLPLPETASAFPPVGAIGRFSISSKLQAGRSVTGNNITVKLSVTGKGSLLFAEPPEIKWPEGFTLINIKSSPINGFKSTDLKTSRSFEYTLMAQQAGKAIIPAVTFRYFDPVKKQYEQASTKAINIDILPGKQIAFNTDSNSPTPGNATSVIPDTNSAAMELSKVEQGSIKKPFNNNFLLAATLAFGAASAFLFRVFKKNREKVIPENLPVAITETADPLFRLDNMIRTKQFQQFYTEIYNIIWNTISTSMNVVPGDQNKTHIIGLLSARGWSDTETKELGDLLDRCAWNLYVPDPENTDSYNEIYQRTERIVKRLQNAS